MVVCNCQIYKIPKVPSLVKQKLIWFTLFCLYRTLCRKLHSLRSILNKCKVCLVCVERFIEQIKSFACSFQLYRPSFIVVLSNAAPNLEPQTKK